MENNNDWLAIVYKLPSHPSRIRVNVWRKLKKAGALYYQQGLAMLPRSEHFLEFSKELKKEIISNGGQMLIANFSFIDDDDAKNAVDEFNSGLSREVMNIKKIEDKIRLDIENTENSNLLTASFLEEKLNMINKLKKAYETIKQRDCFKISLSERLDEHIDSLLQKVQHYYNEFKKSVSTANNM